MSTKTVVVQIEADGSVTIDAQNFKGNTCSLATKELEKALSGGDLSAVSDKKKPEYALNPTTKTQAL